MRKRGMRMGSSSRITVYIKHCNLCYCLVDGDEKEGDEDGLILWDYSVQ
jgi:hypothetical protein